MYMAVKCQSFNEFKFPYNQKPIELEKIPLFNIECR